MMNKQPSAPKAKSWSGWILAAFMAISLFLLITEHRAHALGWVLHLLLGACVLLLYLNTRAYESDDQTDGGGSH
jgi:hypothetical protein